MVIGWSQSKQQTGDQASGSAWAQVEAAQRQARLPCLLIPQPAHAVLAGEIAAQLTCFGELPAEIIRAIQMHDTGWAASDAQQIQQLRSPNAGNARPVSFITISPREAEEAWTASIEAVGAFSPLGATVVSRHFTLLAQHDPAQHRRFLEAQKSRGFQITPDIEIWTAALGFCDLLSLYLLCGWSREVEFPLAHPSSPQAKTAPRLKMQIDGEHIHFLPQAVLPGSIWTIHTLVHPLPANRPRSETLTWTVP
jgi:Protein of unknown function (DUF3891)